MFTPEERARLRSSLLQRAEADPRISAAAITGSAAAGAEDRWSDIDLALAVSGELAGVLEDWTQHMRRDHAAVHHVDVHAGPWIYRVFLLASTLQVDLAFAPAAEFRALGPAFRMAFGTANDPRHVPSPRVADLAGYAWLHALHARSCIARGKFWQAEYMISGARDYALALACVRHGLPAVHGRGMDRLPAEVTAKFEGSLVAQLDADHLSRAFRVAVEGLVDELRHTDEAHLEATLRRLTET